jgi:hypothetical protein
MVLEIKGIRSVEIGTDVEKVFGAGLIHAGVFNGSIECYIGWLQYPLSKAYHPYL